MNFTVDHFLFWLVGAVFGGAMIYSLTPTHHDTTTPPACTRAALAAAQAQADWITIDNAHNIADQAALNHATYRQYRRLLLDIPARPKVVDLAVCK